MRVRMALLKTLGVVLVSSVVSCVEPAPGVASNHDPPSQSAQGIAPPTLRAAALKSPEPVCQRETTILCEDFESPDQSNWSDYKDNNFDVRTDDAFGGARSMRQRYDQGQVGAGWLAWFFGDHPSGGVRRGESFDEIYFRFYHKFQAGWPDAYPQKVARVRSHFIDGGWRFAWEEHFWINYRRPGGRAVSDPASHLAAPNGTVWMDDRRWLGTKAMSLRFADRVGEWVAVEMRVKLNTPGQNDGEITYWIDGEQLLERRGLNIRGAYTATTINTAMIDTYWNGGSPQEGLKRWYDNVVVSTERIGCATFSIEKSALDGQSAWQVQVARALGDTAVVWDSGEITGAGTSIDITAGVGTLLDGERLCVARDRSYRMRARHSQGREWSAWSGWAGMFEEPR